MTAADDRPRGRGDALDTVALARDVIRCDGAGRLTPERLADWLADSGLAELGYDCRLRLTRDALGLVGRAFG